MFFAVFSVLLIVAMAVLLGCCNAIEVCDDANKLAERQNNKEKR
ncbi:hypothetical protein [Clostridium omnivorum]|uniref:DUF3789 domain-containing protein n=1 Tax=Clostridium omnivorum TaxID=1604902 RepID=A0ABQ5NC22_9CLOT|nr:hypothetical protein [Clostridium sp. E14]GLC32776.1 hypothetical protein bsdE14_41860 [Clostridium sp. E14]